MDESQITWLNFSKQLYRTSIPYQPYALYKKALRKRRCSHEEMDFDILAQFVRDYLSNYNDILDVFNLKRESKKAFREYATEVALKDVKDLMGEDYFDV